MTSVKFHLLKSLRKSIISINGLTYFADIDECTDSTINQCEHLCENILGSFRCACQEGFRLEDDGQSCEGKKAVKAVSFCKWRR